MRKRLDRHAALQRADAGLTLMEVMVALMLVASGLLLALQWLPMGPGRADVRQVGYEMALGLRQARTKATTQSREVGFIFDAASRSWRVGERGAPHPLPKGIQVRMQAADQLNLRPREGRIVFFPDASSTGGVIIVTGRNRSIRIEVDWLTGKISIIEEER